MTRESFVFYRSFYEATKDLEPVDYKSAVNAIVQYALNGIESKDLTPIAQAIFVMAKPQIDKNNRRYVSGCKGGAPVGNQNARKQPKNNQNQPNDNDNDNDNGNDNGNGINTPRRRTKFSNFPERDVDYNEIGQQIMQNQLSLVRGGAN